MEHLKTDKIQSYIEKQIKGSEVTEIELHLATCERCRGSYMGLKSVGEYIQSSFKEEKATDSCPEDWKLGALVREELPPDASKKISDHMKECSFCIDRVAVYYKALEHKEKAIDTPELWTEKAFQSLAGDSVAKEKEVSTFKQILAFIKKLTLKT